MGDEAAVAAAKKAEINLLKYIEQRVATAFPALVGPKFTAKYATEANEYVLLTVTLHSWSCRTQTSSFTAV